MVAVFPDDPIDPIDPTPPGYWARIWDYIRLLLELQGQDTSDAGPGSDSIDGGI